MGKEELGKSRIAKQTGVDSLETFKAGSEYKLKFRSDCKVLICKYITHSLGYGSFFIMNVITKNTKQASVVWECGKE